MEPKKISFGFTKLLKKPVAQITEEKKQFIDCLEGKSIKVKGGEIVEEKQPLVIPLKERTTTAASLARIAQEVESEILNSELPLKEDEIQPEKPPPPENESLEEMAAREILEDLNKNKHKDKPNSSLVVPVTELPTLTGEKESTLEDYESIPIADFGLAMLRGMGWQPGKGMGKHEKSTNLALPTLRPKGMGLGADKSNAKINEKQNGQAKEEEIKLIKGSHVKIVAGKQAGTYGQITGFDDDSGRIIVKAALGGANLNLNEFMVQTITPLEYNKQSKVINAAKYEEYKLRESNIKSEKREPRQSVEKTVDKIRKSSPAEARGRSPTAFDSESRRYRMDNSRSSRRRNSSSSSRSSPERRDRDKKRKGKKKKRDRSRSKDRRHRH